VDNETNKVIAAEEAIDNVEANDANETDLTNKDVSDEVVEVN
jgi:hypothetical protein